MDAIILAAGENTRLQAAGLPPGKKPLLLVENEVLIRRLTRQSRECGCNDIVIVASPSNVEDIVFATQEFKPRYVVQPSADGPQEALTLALDASRHAGLFLLLMGDNHIVNDRLPRPDRATVSVVGTSSTALQRLDDGQFTYEKQRSEIGGWRWLGPLWFMPSQWHKGAKTWVRGFDGARFEYITSLRCRDLGTLPS